MLSKFKINKKIILSLMVIILFIAGIYVVPFRGYMLENTEEDSIDLPIIMYHGISKSTKCQGRYVISPQEFESDLKYITENGYHTVFIDDVINYAYSNADLPEKPIMITFDDGYYNNYLYAFPLLQKYNCKMVLSPIGKYTDLYSDIEDKNPDYAHCTWDNINEMLKSGLIEVENHSYDMHTINKKDGRNGAKKIKGESLEHYKKFLVADIMKMQDDIKEKTGVQAQAFTYPFGAISNDSLDIMRDLGFKTVLTCEGKINKITHNPDSIKKLNRFIRPHNVSTEKLFDRISKNRNF